MKTHLGEMYAALNGIIWGISVVLFRKCGDFVSPIALNFFKNCISLILFVITLCLMGGEFLPNGVTGNDYAVLAASGALGIAVSDTLAFRSLNVMGASNWAIIECLYTPTLFFLGFLFLDERMTFVQLIGASLVICATLMVSKIQSDRFSSRRDAMIGIGLGAFAVVTNALSLVIIKPVLLKADVVWITSFRLIVGIVLLTLFNELSRPRENLWISFKPSAAWGWLIPATVLGNYVALFLWLAGSKYTNVGVAAVLNKLSTVVIIVLSVVFLKERLTLTKIVAALLGMGGAALMLG